MRRFLCISLIVIPALGLANPFWFDPMSYAVGNIATTSTNLWSVHSGTGGDSLEVFYAGSGTAAAGNRYEVNQGRTDDVHRWFFPNTNGFDNASGSILYASFTASLTTLPANGGGTYFAHFMDTNIIFRARVFALTNGAYPGTWRVGIANLQPDFTNGVPTTGPTAVVPIDLATNTDYQFVIRYNTGTGAGALWVNPASEGDNANSATATDSLAVANAMAGFAFRQSAGEGVLELAKVSVGTNFLDVVTNVPGVPVIGLQPVGFTNYSGNPGVLEVAASGMGMLNYQWLRNGSSISGATSQTYTIASLSGPDTGTYQCLISSAGGGTNSVSVSVSVNTTPTPPGFTQQPANATKAIGGSATFSALVFGTGPLAYQWKFNGSPIANGTNPDGSVISGATAATLTVSNVGTNEAGSYTLSVTGGAGSTNSSGAILTVVPAQAVTIAFLRTLEDTNNWLASDTNTLWNVTGVISTYTNITSGNTASYYIQDNTAGINLFVNNSGFRPSRGDWVTASGKLASFNSALELSVDVSNPYMGATIISNNAPLPAATGILPTITNDVAASEALEGSLVALTDVHFTNATILGSVNTRLSVTNSSGTRFTLYFPNSLDLDSRGKTLPSFAWSVTGPLSQNLANTGTPRNANYEIVVTRFSDIATNPGPPIIVSQPTGQLAAVGMGAAFSVTVSGQGPITYQWQYNGVNLFNGAHYSGSQTTNLMINNVQAGDVGGYRVVASNPYGSVTSSIAQLNLVTTPAFTAISAAGGFFTMSFTGYVGTTYLQSANTTNGPWTIVGAATSPYSASMSGAAQYYRLYMSDYGVYSRNEVGWVNVTANTDMFVLNPFDSTYPLTLDGVMPSPPDGTYVAFNGGSQYYDYVQGFGWEDSFTLEPAGSTVIPVQQPFEVGPAAPFNFLLTGEVYSGLAATNHPPVANGQSVSTPEDTPKQITLTGSDPDSDPITFVIVTGTTNGMLNGFNPTAGSLTYTPDANFNGTDAFTFRVNDGQTNSATALVSITVTPVNDAPVAANQAVTTPEDTPTNLILTATDVDSSGLVYAILAGPTNGTLSTLNPNTGAVTYMPATNVNGADAFTFTASDGSLYSTGLVSITVSPVDDAPVANAQSVTTPEDTSKLITLTASDVENDPLTYSIVAGPTNGTLSGLNPTAGTVTYAPNTNFNGSDAFTFLANDGQSNSAPALVSITVTPVNDAPIAVNDSYSLMVNTTLRVPAPGILTNDIDVDGDTLMALLSTNVQHGTLSFSNNGGFSYTPLSNFFGSDSFRYRVTDGQATSAVATVSLAINSAPAITSQPRSFLISPGTNTTFSVGAQGTAPLRFQWRKNGTNIAGATGASLVVINVTTNDSAVYTVVVTNSFGMVTSSMAGLTVSYPYYWRTIAGTAGVAGSADGTNNALLNEPLALAMDSQGNLFVADSGNGTIRQLTLTPAGWVSSTIAGTVGVYGSADGTNDSAQFGNSIGITVGPGGDLFVADDYFATIRKVSRVGTDWVVTTVAGDPTQQGVSDGTNSSALFTTPVGIASDAVGNLYVSDFDAHTLRKISPIGPDWVVTTIVGNGGTPGYADGTNTSALLQNPTGVAVDAGGTLYVADDGNSVVRQVAHVAADWVSTTIAGSVSNYAVIDSPGRQAAFENLVRLRTDASTNLQAVDYSAYAVRKLTRVGTNWLVNTIGGLTNTPGTADGTGASARFGGPYDIAVGANGHIFVADSDSFTIREGVLLNGQVVITSQPQPQTNGIGSNITFTVQALGSAPLAYQWQLNGTNLNDGGRISGAGSNILSISNLLAGDAGDFRVIITNSIGAVTSFVARLTIRSANEPPVANADSYSLLINSTLTVSAPGVLANDTDAESDPLTAVLVNGPANGNLVLNSDGSFAYTPVINYFGSDSFTYQANDGQSNSTPATVTLTINSPPQIIDQPQSQSISAGSDVALDVAAIGTAPLVYSWRLNGTNLLDNGRIMGSASSNLSIAGLYWSDAGNYDVVITNTYGAVTSTVVSLATTDPFVQAGDVLAIDAGTGNFLRYRPFDQSFVTIASFGINRTGIAVGDGSFAGTAWICGPGYASLLKVNLADGSVSSVAANTGYYGVAYHDGLVYAANFNSGGVDVYDAATGNLVNSYPSGLGGSLLGIAWDANNQRFVLANFGESRLDVMTTNGVFTTLIAGSGTAGTNQIDRPYFVTCEAPNQYLVGYFVDNQDRVQRITLGATTNILTIGESLNGPLAAVADGQGKIYIGNYDQGTLRRMNADGSGLETLTGAGAPSGGKLYDVAIVGTNQQSAPFIATQPPNQTAAPGATATFVVAANGAPPLSYQWQFNGTNLANGAHIAGAQSANLTVSNVSSADTGNYQVLVTNVYGSATSAVAVLTLKSNATVTLGNLAQTYDGTAKAVSVVTSPTGLVVNVTYNGSITLPTNAGSYTVVGTINDSNYAGAATNTLVINKAAGSVTLTNLTQTYDGSPKNASAVTVPPGLTVGFTYNGSGTAPINAGSYTVVGTINDPNYQGTATNMLVISKATATVTLGNLSQTFDGTAKSVSVSTAPPGLTVTVTYNGSTSAPTNAGNYTVIGTVVDSNYQGSSTNLMTIGLPPQITSQPQSQTVNAGTNALFTVTATGTPTLAYQWMYNGTNLPGATLTSLTIANAQSTNQGNYNVLVTNAFGAATSSVATLTVTSAAPSIVTQPQSKVASVGQNATLFVVANGSDPLSYQWQLNGTAISGQTRLSIALTNLQLSAAGPYTVVVSNFAGMVTSAVANVSVLAPDPYLFSTIMDTNGALPSLNSPSGVAVDSQNNLYIADTASNRVLKAVPSGTNWIISTITTLAARPSGVAVDSGGSLYVSSFNDQTISRITMVGSNWVVSSVAGTFDLSGSADGTNGSALFNNPYGVAVDAGTNIYVADEHNDVIRKISPSGTNWITKVIAGTVGAQNTQDGTNGSAHFNLPAGVALDSGGNLYVVEFGGSIVRRLAPQGTNWVVTTVAGLAGVAGVSDGTNSGARFSNPVGIAVDGFNSVYVQDTGNGTVRKLSASGTNWVVTTIGGLAGSFGTADGTGSAARFFSPQLIAAVPAGDVYIADAAVNRIRKGTLLGSPVITSQPQSRTNLVGDSVTFTVSVTGPTPLGFQWRLAGTNLSDNAHVSGTQSNSLAIPFVQVSDAGNYSVVIANPYGSITSAVATLTIKECSSLQSPVAWWRAEGDGADFIGVNNGTLHSVAFQSGIVGQSFNFDGVSSYIDAGNLPDLRFSGQAPFAIEGWINPQSSGTIISKFNETVEGEWLLFLMADGTVGFGREIAPFVILSNQSIPFGQFTHVAAVYDGTWMKIFINGQLDTQTDQIGASRNADNTSVLIGARWVNGAPGDFFQGLIDELSVYNRALSSNEVASVYNAGIAGKCPESAAPVVTVQPQDVTVGLGSLATFSVQVAGKTPLGYRWQSNNADVTDTGRVSGAQSPDLSISNAQLSDSGGYRIIVTNAYGSVTSRVAVLIVNKLAGTVSLSNLAQTFDGTPRAVSYSTSPNGLAVNVTYNGSTTVPTNAGSFTVIGTINDPAYQGSATNTLVVAKATPTVTWTNPAAIVYPTALGLAQLNAVGTVPGTFAYSPSLGIVLSIGTNSLTAVFNAADAVDYNSVTSAVSIVVSRAALVVSANNATRPYGQTNPVFTGTITGMRSGDNITATYTCSATTNSPLGAYPIVPTLSDPNNKLGNYSVTTNNGTLTIVKATPAIAWVTPAPITYGAALSATQLNATASIPGAFIYNPAAGSIPAARTNVLTVTFSPGDTVNYNAATSSVALLVNKAAMTVTANSASRTEGDTNPVFSGTLVGLTNGDNITATFTSTATAASPAGSYPIIPSLSDPGNRLGNYTVTTNHGTLTIFAANDMFANRKTINGVSNVLTSSNFGATKEAGEPDHAGNSGGHSLWWTWTAPANGTVTIDTIGSSFDTLLAVYTGTSVSNLTAVASDDESGGNHTSRLRFNADPNATYQIAVDGFGGAVGSIQLNLFEEVGPPQFTLQPVGQTVLAGAGVSFSATVKGSQPFGYQWQKDGVNISGATNAQLGTNTSYAIASTRTNDSGAYSVIASNSFGTTMSATAVLSVVTRPDNDAYGNAFVLTGNSAAASGNNIYATADGFEPSFFSGHSIWWSWTAPTNATVRVDTTGSSFDTVLGVYTNGPSGTNLVAFDDNSGGNFTSLLRFDSTAGVTYRFGVDGWRFAAGNNITGGVSLHLNLEFNPPNIVSQPQGQSAELGWSVSSSVSAVGSAPLSFQWRKDGADISGATNATYNIASVQAGDGGNYSVQVSNAFGTVISSNAALTIYPQPANDSFANRIAIGGLSNTVFGVNVEATKESGEPNHAGNTGGRSVWWSWTAPTNGTVIISTIGSSFDTLLAVYTGSSIFALAPVASDDNGGGNLTSKVGFTGVAGTTYQIAVDGSNPSGPHGAAFGNIVLNVQQSAVFAPQVLVPPQSQAAASGSTVNFSVTAVGSPAFTYQWLSNGVTLLGKTNSTLQLKNVSTNFAAAYSVMLSNVGGITISDPGILRVERAINPGFRANWPGFASGSAEDVDVQDGLAYVATTSGFLVLDVSDPESPRRIGNYAGDSGASRIAMQDGFAYVLTISNQLGAPKLDRFDVRNPGVPVKVREFATANAVDFSIAGDSLCVLDGQNITVLDTNCVQQGSINAGAGIGRSIVGSNDIAYVAGVNGIAICSVSNPAAPSLLETLSSANVGVAGNASLALSSGYLYTLTGGQRTVKFQVLDPGNPTHPQIGINVLSNLLGQASQQAMAAGSNLAFVVTAGASGNALGIFDVTQPGSPQLVGSSLFAEGTPQHVASEDALVYVANGGAGLKIFDVSDPAHPIAVGQFLTAVQADGVALQGNLAFVMDANTGFHVLDVTDPTAPVTLGSYQSTNGASGIAIKSHYVYLALNAPPTSITIAGPTLEIIDVADPGNPVLVGSVDLPSPLRLTLPQSGDPSVAVSAVAVSGNLALVASYLGTNAALGVVDVSNPQSPRLVSRYDLPNASLIKRIDFQSPYAYVADANSGLRIFDLSFPQTPSQVGSFAEPSMTLSVSVRSNQCLLTGIFGTDLIDVSQPLNPARVGTNNVSSAMDWLQSPLALSSGTDGIKTYDLINFTNPLVLGQFVGSYEQVVVQGRYAFGSAGSAGLTILDLGSGFASGAGIQDQPADVRVSAGATAAFYVGATGTVPLSYQWQFNGADIPGETGPLLEIRNAQTNAIGYYSVRVSNASGTVTSRSAALTVNPLPQVALAQPTESETFAPPATITLAANASDPDGAIASVAFYENAALIGIVSNAPFSITVSNLGVGSYVFQARATDNEGAWTESVSVTNIVSTSKVIQLSQSSYSVSEGAGAALLTVQRNFADAASVTISSSDGTAHSVVNGVGDYFGISNTIAFPAGVMSTNITISLINDLVYRGNRTFNVALSAPSGGWALANPAVAQVTIVDDDSPSTTNSFTQVQFPDGAPGSLGSLEVDLSPSQAAGSWRFAWDNEWHDSGGTLTGLQPGVYPVQFMPRSGFTEPASTNYTVVAGSNYLAATYITNGSPQFGGLSVSLLPLEIQTGTNRGQWRVQGESGTNWFDSGAVVPNLPVGFHIVEFKTISGYETPAARFLPVVAGATNASSATYSPVSANAGAGPVALNSFATISNGLSAGLPFAFNGQILSDAGYGSGFVVRRHAVLTAAHVIFDPSTLSLVQNVRWFFQRYAGQYEPMPLQPQASFVMSGYAAARTNDLLSGIDPGDSSLNSRNLDVAALSFADSADDNQLPGRGGEGGYLVSDLAGTDWLETPNLKLLLGYPVEQVDTGDKGKLFQAGPGAFQFAQLTNAVYRSFDLKSYPGNSGGPLCVLATNTAGAPFFIPSGVFLGGSGQTVVREIDNDVVNIINQAENASGGGGNSTGGGVSLWGVDPTTAPPFSVLFRVDLLPHNAVSPPPGWRVSGTLPWITDYTDWYIVTNHAVATNLTIEFNNASGFATPLTISTNVTLGRTTNGVIISVISANYIAIPPAQLVVTPSGSFAAAGALGGPFTPATATYTLFNSGGQSLSWFVSKSASTTWLSISPASGTLLSGQSTNVQITLTAVASNLTTGVYSDGLTFLNNSSGSLGSTNRPISLTIGAGTPITLNAPLRLQNGGLQLVLNGHVGKAYVIEVSTNLSTWSSNMTITNISGSITFTNMPSAGATRGFYRARELP